MRKKNKKIALINLRAKRISCRFATLQGTGALLGEAEVLLGQPLQGLVLGDLHARAHVAVAVHEEGESAGQVLAKRREKKRRRRFGMLKGERVSAQRPPSPHSEEQMGTPCRRVRPSVGSPLLSARD